MKGKEVISNNRMKSIKRESQTERKNRWRESHVEVGGALDHGDGVRSERPPASGQWAASDGTSKRLEEGDGWKECLGRYKKAVDDAGKGFDSCDAMFKAYDKHWNFVDKPSDDGTPGEVLKKKYVQSVIENAKKCDPVAWKEAYEIQELKHESDINEHK